MTKSAHLPHRRHVIAGLVTGAKRGHSLIRQRYHLQGRNSREEDSALLIAPCFLAKKFSAAISTTISKSLSAPAANICGEESALIEAIEGHRAEPRNKPAVPRARSACGKNLPSSTTWRPLSMFTNPRPRIDWFVAQGAGGTRGLKFVGVSGHVTRPGIFESPWAYPCAKSFSITPAVFAAAVNSKPSRPQGPLPAIFPLP